jgi:zinc finger protein
MTTSIIKQDAPTTTTNMFEDIDADQQCMEIESLCMACRKNGTTRLLLTVIPHFKEVILMAFECPHCGLRNNEIQGGAAISDRGAIYTCRVDTKADMNRQIVKGETASIRLVELDFEIPANTQKGLLNTVEGFVMKIVEDLEENQAQRKELDATVWQKIEDVMATLRRYMANEESFTIQVDDPAGNSYIESLCAPSPDPKLHVTHYKRTRDQNIAIGLDPDQEDVAEETASTFMLHVYSTNDNP